MTAGTVRERGRGGEVDMESRYLTTKEASTLIGMSESFLRRSRSEGTIGNRTPAPPFYKIGRTVRYHKDDLEKWMEAFRCD
jgi:excisionase family DNA binding protein